MSQTQGSDDLVTVRRDDLLHCMQVAIWRAGLLDGGVSARLLNGLGISEVPKPSPAVRIPAGATMTNVTVAGADTGMRTYELPEPIMEPGFYQFSVDPASGRVVGVRKIGD